MATKLELAVAAITALRQRGEDPTLEKVQTLVRESASEEISAPTYYQARTKAKNVTVLAPRPTTKTVEEPTGSGLPLEAFLGAVEMARKLVSLLGGDKESAIKLIRSL